MLKAMENSNGLADAGTRTTGMPVALSAGSNVASPETRMFTLAAVFPRTRRKGRAVGPIRR